MTVTATPTLTVAGSAVAASGAGQLVAVDALQVTWGRSSLLERPAPSTARLTVLDRSPSRSFATRRDLIGQVVIVGWTSPDGQAGTNFRGRVTDVGVRLVDPQQPSAGALVSLGASSLEVDAANFLAAAGTVWPAETFAARLARIAALLPAGLFTTAPVLHPSWTGYTAAQLDVSGKDALSLLRQLYDSTARAPVFDPAANGWTYARRRWMGAGGGLPIAAAQLVNGPGGWAATCTPAVSGSFLDGRTLGYAGATSADLAQRITRVECSYLNGAASWAAATAAAAVFTVPGEDAIGRRTLSVDTIHADATSAGAAVSEWSSLVYSEGTVPRLDPLTFRTSAQPFDSAAQRAALLAGVEGSAWYFLRRTWLPSVGLAPFYGIAGGVIGYAGGQWTIQLNPLPCWNTNQVLGMTSQTAAVDNSTRLIDLDESLTFGDCDYIGYGPGFAII